MKLHKRDFFHPSRAATVGDPREFRVQSLRPWDYFFWWVETGNPSEVSTILPAEWGDNPAPAKKPHAAETRANILAPNGVRVISGNCGMRSLGPRLIFAGA